MTNKVDKLTPTADQVVARAEREVLEERTADLVKKYKAKLNQKVKTEELLTGLNRELDAMKLEIQDALGK